MALDLFGPSPRSFSGNTSILVITDRYYKLARTIAQPSTTVPMAAKVFLSYWVLPYGIPDYLLANNGPQLVAKFSDIVWAELETTHMTTKRFNPQKRTD